MFDSQSFLSKQEWRSPGILCPFPSQFPTLGTFLFLLFIFQNRSSISAFKHIETRRYEGNPNRHLHPVYWFVLGLIERGQEQGLPPQQAP